jgi:hypothetical protein
VQRVLLYSVVNAEKNQAGHSVGISCQAWHDEESRWCVSIGALLVLDSPRSAAHPSGGNIRPSSTWLRSRHYPLRGQHQLVDRFAATCFSWLDCCRYVEDHTNKLVRTFTGNLTTVLQNMASLRPNFSLIKQKQPQQQGWPHSPAVPHSMLPVCPTRLRRLTGGSALLGAMHADSYESSADAEVACSTAAAGAGVLGLACSLPISSNRPGRPKINM